MTFLVAQTICNLPQCTACKDIDPDSWSWIFHGCWLFSSSAGLASLGVGALMALYVGIQVWSRKG